VRIILRGGLGFCRQRIINYCERSSVNYIIGLARNPPMQGITEFLELAMKERPEKTGLKQREHGEFVYAAQTWTKERRVITSLEYGEQGNNPRYVVTMRRPSCVLAHTALDEPVLHRGPNMLLDRDQHKQEPAIRESTHTPAPPGQDHT